MFSLRDLAKSAFIFSYSIGTNKRNIVPTTTYVHCAFEIYDTELRYNIATYLPSTTSYVVLTQLPGLKGCFILLYCVLRLGRAAAMNYTLLWAKVVTRMAILYLL